ncbi:hypothetical protein [Leptospira vanthielii]|uniref:Uncharacterized protein n=1 Tax=Leptospira vanthielii serovar Holland str. Waz Holland = ATCC 700522 TaxID=1218591 RepID=N1WFG2_9LEPT|nr:hypothetical protein [Leptospira vanthielii]EMY70576.1 hypothetical protein LEP1GSC199_1091 [Leptospira vanthielii serovar Holland str. Waz Holland = ATCC 700522]
MNPNSFLTSSILYGWIPDFEFNSYDLSDLVVLDQELEKECKTIEDRFHAYLAIYKKGTLAKPKGLCTTFQYAILESKAFDICQEFEKKLDGNILVVYAKPLKRW